MVTANEETAVRNYLLYLDDPSQLVDKTAVDRLEAELVNAQDPIEKLRVMAQLQRLRAGDETPYRDAFVAHAKSWAEKNEVPTGSFQALGVSDAVLRAAGFPITRSASPPHQRQDAAARTSHHVTVGQVKEGLRGRTAPFTLAEVSQTIGGSPMTVRKAVEQLVNEGTVRRLGATPNWKQQGRAPIMFERTNGSAK